MPAETRDPRVLFAAERTLLAWNRTGISLMAFGFVIERFGLFLRMLGVAGGNPASHPFSAVVGTAFILLGTGVCFYSAWQFRRLLPTLGQDRPPGYRAGFGIAVNLLVGVLGLCMSAYVLANLG